jgi:hypothetical protein
MQGKNLVHSPLPFLFGASKDEILDRFWLQITTPKGVEDEYWLEAFPKRVEDARNYKKLELVLSRNDFLPSSLRLYAPNYDEEKGILVHRVFEFRNRKINDALSGIQNFTGNFIRPQTPIGWTRVERPADFPNGQDRKPPEFLTRPAALTNENNPRR